MGLFGGYSGSGQGGGSPPGGEVVLEQIVLFPNPANAGNLTDGAWIGGAGQTAAAPASSNTSQTWKFNARIDGTLLPLGAAPSTGQPFLVSLQNTVSGLLNGTVVQGGSLTFKDWWAAGVPAAVTAGTTSGKVTIEYQA